MFYSNYHKHYRIHKMTVSGAQLFIVINCINVLYKNYTQNQIVIEVPKTDEIICWRLDHDICTTIYTILNYLTNERLKFWGLLSNFKIILKVSFIGFQTQVFRQAYCISQFSWNHREIIKMTYSIRMFSINREGYKSFWRVTFFQKVIIYKWNRTLQDQ